MRTLHTIGYEGIDLPRFMALLRAHDVETLIDVRELPLSRKRGFSKNALAQALSGEGLGYAHLPRLGCPKTIRARHKADGDWDRYTRDFMAHLAQQEEPLREVVALAREATCALMCFEADHHHCHRSMVADAAARMAGSLRVHHIPVSGQQALT